MGALTSKPYAFTARPWELKSLNTIDCFDSFGSLLRVDVRGLDIMRILPRVNDALNEEWISDRARFSYDGLKRQRLTSPLLHTGEGFKKVGWSQMLAFLLRTILLNRSFKNLDILVGKLQTFNSFYSTVGFVNGLKSVSAGLKANFYYFESLSKNSALNSFRTDYIAPLPSFYKSFDVALFLNSNLRLESPILNIKVRKGVVSRGASAFNWGLPFNYNYPVYYLGNSALHLISLLQGRHPLSRSLLNFKAPLVISSSFRFRSFNLRIVLNTFITRLKRFSLSTVSLNLGSTTSTLMAFDYGLLSNNRDYSVGCEVESSELCLILGDDDICFDRNRYTNVIYAGHHGDRNALLSDLIIPTPFMFEERGSLMNLTGLYNQTDLVINPPALTRTPFSVFNALFLLLLQLLGSFSSETGFSRLEFLTIKPYLFTFLGYGFSGHKLHSRSFAIRPSFSLAPLLSKSTPLSSFKDGFISSFDTSSYYKDNSILRSSHVMALSMSRFGRYDHNFK